MANKRIIYQNGGPDFGEVWVTPVLPGGFVLRAGVRTSPTVPEIKFWRRLPPLKFSLGLLANFFVLFSVVGFSSLVVPILSGELSLRFRKPQPEVRLSFGDILNSNQVEASFLAPDPAFSIVIPKISAQAKVFPNVSPADKNEYLPVLKQGVAHARGTALPGQIGNIYLFAHSTDSPANIAQYNAVFYGLKDLEQGDQIVIFFEGRLHLYKVTEKKIVPASDVSYFEPQDKEEVLILQTCWPPGTTLDRLLVFAKKA